MADDDMNFDDDGASTSSKKAKGLGGLVPSLLKWVAIILGAIILIVTVVIVTMSIINSNSPKQAYIPINEEYTPQREVYSWYKSIPVIKTKSNDSIPASIMVHVVLGYKLDDAIASSEITARQVELQDYLRKYFSSKRSTELTPMNEDALKLEIKNDINDLLTQSSIKDVRFLTFEVIQQ